MYFLFSLHIVGYVPFCLQLDHLSRHKHALHVESCWPPWRIVGQRRYKQQQPTATIRMHLNTPLLPSAGLIPTQESRSNSFWQFRGKISNSWPGIDSFYLQGIKKKSKESWLTICNLHESTQHYSSLSPFDHRDIRCSSISQRRGGGCMSACTLYNNGDQALSFLGGKGCVGMMFVRGAIW